MKKATQSKDYSRGTVRVMLGPAAMRKQCAEAALELEREAEATVTACLTQSPLPPVEDILRAVDVAERYEAAAAKVRKWSGRFT